MVELETTIWSFALEQYRSIVTIFGTGWVGVSAIVGQDLKEAHLAVEMMQSLARIFPKSEAVKPERGCWKTGGGNTLCPTPFFRA